MGYEWGQLDCAGIWRLDGLKKKKGRREMNEGGHSSINYRTHTYMYRCGIREVSSSNGLEKSKANGAVGWRNDRGNLDE